MAPPTAPVAPATATLNFFFSAVIVKNPLQTAAGNYPAIV
jgi:hypothetical protein